MLSLIICLESAKIEFAVLFYDLTATLEVPPRIHHGANSERYA